MSGQGAVHPSAARIVDLYERRAADWDAARARGKFLEKPILDRLVAGLPSGGAVLDVGCGAGAPIAEYLIERGLSVTGIDSSPSLIARCRERYPQGEWIVADMRRLALGRAFDGLIAWHSLFHLTPGDQRAMLAVLAAHAAPGAHLLFTHGHGHGETIGEFGGEPLYHASLDLEEYDRVLAMHGFETVASAVSDPECGAASWRMARRRA